MPQENKSELTSRVFILGAGLSAECGAPLISNFFSEPFIDLMSPHNKLKIVEFLGILDDAENCQNIEEILGLIDTNIVRGTSIGSYSPSDLHQIRKIILEGINEILTRIWDGINEELGIEKIDNPYAALLSEIGQPEEILQTKLIRSVTAELQYFSNPQENNNIHKERLPTRAEGWINSYVSLIRILKPNDTIITFNYDNFLELALSYFLNRQDIDLGFNYFELSPDVDIRCHGDLYYRIRTPQSVQYKITILKPHGSLNWGICSNCGEIIVTYLTPLLSVKGYIDTITESATEEEKERHFCCKKFNPQLLIVEPTWLKMYTNKYLSQVIETAIQKLSYADEIFFIGYSFSKSDNLIREILTKSLHERAGKPWGKVNIVDTSHEAISRYQVFFPSLKIHQVRASEFLKEMPRYKGIWRDPPKMVGRGHNQ